MYTLLVTRTEKCQRRSIGSGSGRTTSQNKSVKSKPWVSDDGIQFRFEIPVPTEIDHSYRDKCKYYVVDVVLTYQTDYMTSNSALFRFKGDSPFNPNAVEYGQKYYTFPNEVITTNCGRIVRDTPRKVERLSSAYSCSTTPRLGVFMDFDTIPDDAEIELNIVKGDYYQEAECEYPPHIRELIIDGTWVDDFNSPIPVNRPTCPDLTKEMIIEQHEAYLAERESI
ncbi:hypothetical protein L4C54_11750 [Vibrio lamellibrachiae]|uniref:hypothetical protein n=1 Tax=Vibrio lamellibrachiae TaxID=2910253 RepID=UPI003D109F37